MLRAGQSGFRTLVGARSFLFPRPPPGTHPDSSTIGTGSISGAKRSGRHVHHPPSFSAEVEPRWSYASTPLYAFIACSVLDFTVLWYINMKTLHVVSIRLSRRKLRFIVEAIGDSSCTAWRLTMYCLATHFWDATRRLRNLISVGSKDRNNGT